MSSSLSASPRATARPRVELGGGVGGGTGGDDAPGLCRARFPCRLRNACSPERQVLAASGRGVWTAPADRRLKSVGGASCRLVTRLFLQLVEQIWVEMHRHRAHVR